MQSEIFIARIKDTALISERSNKPKFLGFLSEEEAVLAEKTLNNSNSRFKFFGGYKDAKRVILCCFPDYLENMEFPITALTFSFRKEDKLSHRDFLGSLMALGINRETVGDILVEESRAVAFVSDEIADYILQQVEKIGRTGVNILKGFSMPLPENGKLAEFDCTVASERLDCVVSALCNFSRAQAAEKINLGLVSVNSIVSEKCTKQVFEKDIISVRGKGKFIIVSISDKTRKNRIVLKYKKYI